MTEWWRRSLTGPCSVLESLISRSTWWIIDLKVLQRAGLLAGREDEWTISSASKSRQRRFGAESSITGKKQTKLNMSSFFVLFSVYTKVPWSGRNLLHNRSETRRPVNNTTNRPATGVCSRQHSSMSSAHKTMRQRGKTHTHIQPKHTHTLARRRKYPRNSCREIITVYPVLAGKEAEKRLIHQSVIPNLLQPWDARKAWAFSRSHTKVGHLPVACGGK